MKKHKSKEALKALEEREYRREQKTGKERYLCWHFHYIYLAALFFAVWFLCLYGFFRLAQIYMR